MNNFSEEAKFVLQFINETNRSIFLTGKAGTGKTTLLKEIIQTTHKNAVIVAPTGIAALNAGGVTIHSFFHLPFAAFVPDTKNPPIFTDNIKFENKLSLKRHMRMSRVRKALFLNMDLLVIDEVSMLRADVLDAMNFMLQSIRKNPQPFGGVQVLFIGDLLQLPPVVKQAEWDVLQRYYGGVFFFHSEVVRQFPPLYIELDKVFRQSDQEFIQILNNLRNNQVTTQDVQLLNKFIKTDFDIKNNPGYITLTTHNTKADKINKDALDGIDKKEFVFKPDVVGDFPEKLFPLEANMSLKVGAQVIFIKNDISPEKRFYNGKMGIVKSLSNNEIFVHFPEENETIEVEKYEWENIKYTVDPNTKEIVEEVLGTFTHYPLKLAWAITVHKSQGLTFDKAVLDVSSVFLPGQAYVALSRLRSLDGLVLLSPIQMNGLVNDEEVMSYANNKATVDRLTQELQLATKDFLRNFLIDTYSWFNLGTLWHAHIHTYDAETDRSKKNSFKPWAIKTTKSLNEMLIHSEKFVHQLRCLFNEENFRFAHVKERVNKAYQYFFPMMDHLVFELLFNIAQVKGKRQLKGFYEELVVLEDALLKQVIQMKKAEKMLQLLEEGKKISKENLRSLEISEYKINHLVNIANILKDTQLDLDEDDDVSKYSSTKKGEKKEKKKSTTAITLEYWKQKKSIEEIAEIRKLVPTTIYSHLGKLVGDGLIQLDEILPKDKINELEQLFITFKDKPLSEIKATVEDLYSWEELKLFQRAKEALKDSEE
ncbi:helix-turn-helix domain-containing protein [Myroides phaeus]|uniref:Helix-turn-helix domain-containing protein n=1 Tax=Myroides phaeus TaxID=702745 RepID=A0A1G8B3T4_9FLAO|nr:helix-turn-helix domain-containing protein [Myroides phaeus]SDH27785.1 Helix-turn-helix domain-containing protein [Myroides phaeus]